VRAGPGHHPLCQFCLPTREVCARAGLCPVPGDPPCVSLGRHLQLCSYVGMQQYHCASNLQCIVGTQAADSGPPKSQLTEEIWGCSGFEVGSRVFCEMLHLLFALIILAEPSCNLHVPFVLLRAVLRVVAVRFCAGVSSGAHHAPERGGQGPAQPQDCRAAVTCLPVAASRPARVRSLLNGSP
jgi:hypothetical protein